MSLTALTGCLTSQDNPAQFDAADNQKCIGYGMSPGTPAYTDCRMKLEKERAMIAAEEDPGRQGWRRIVRLRRAA